MNQSVDALYKPLETKLDAIALQFLCIRLDIFLSSLLYLARILLSMSIY
jgi:hypothetical protein